MTAQHTVAWTIEPEWVGGRVTCHGDYPDLCHTVCADLSCEESPACGHELQDYGCCVEVEWFTDSPLEERYDGPEVPVRDGDIEVVWDDDRSDGPLWHYAEPAS